MNRRTRRLEARFRALGWDQAFLYDEVPHLAARYHWLNTQRRLRHAFRLGHRGTTKPIDSTPIDPLHTQWLSGTLTPWEYQHLVRRSQAASQDLEPRERADPDWWLRVASDIEDDFLYRHLAPCGAD